MAHWSLARNRWLVWVVAALASAAAVDATADSDVSAAPRACELARCASEIADGQLVVLGKADYKHQVTLGANALPLKGSVGLMGLYRLKRTTLVTFMDLWLEGYIVPALRDHEKTWTYGRARFKRSNRWLSATWLYDWSTYELKTATDEGISLRASLASGFGTFLLHSEAAARLVNLHLEVGFVVDYANLRAYADQVFNGYARSALELDVRYGDWVGKSVSTVSYQVTTAAPDHYTPDQTRHEFDLLLGYNATRTLRLALGATVNHYFLRPPDDPKAPRLSYTLFVGASFRP